jgi:hypothetical protein
MRVKKPLQPSSTQLFLGFPDRDVLSSSPPYYGPGESDVGPTWVPGFPHRPGLTAGDVHRNLNPRGEAHVRPGAGGINDDELIYTWG